MQSNHVYCEANEQFDYCGYNSTYWTTKLEVDGNGALCGSSNMFWRSGWCACPSNPNMTFTAGWLEGGLTNDYTNELNNSKTKYTRKTKFQLKSTIGKDVVLLGMDAQGNLQTSKTFGGPGEDVATSITTITQVAGNSAMNNGGFAISGFFDSGINFSDSPADKLTAIGTDAFIAIFDSNGDHVKSKNGFSDGYDVRSKAITTDSDGNFIVVLSVKESASDLVGYTEIVKLDTQLDVVWRKYIAGAAHDIDPGNIIIHENNNISIAGGFSGEISVDNKALSISANKYATFVVTINKDGLVYNPIKFGISSSPIVVTAIRKGLGDRFYLAGNYTADITQGSEVFTAGPETSSFIARLDWKGQYEVAHSFGTDGMFQINDMATNREDVLCLVGEYNGDDMNIGGFDIPNTNGVLSGFILPVGDIFEDAAKAVNASSFIDPVTMDAGTTKTAQIVDVYPNPFKDQLTIDLFSEQSGKIQVEIYHISGQLLSQNEFDVVEGINAIKLNNGFDKVNGVLQIKTTTVDGEVFIDKVIKLD